MCDSDLQTIESANHQLIELHCLALNGPHAVDEDLIAPELILGALRKVRDAYAVHRREGKQPQQRVENALEEAHLRPRTQQPQHEHPARVEKHLIEDDR